MFESKSDADIFIDLCDLKKFEWMLKNIFTIFADYNIDIFVHSELFLKSSYNF